MEFLMQALALKYTLFGCIVATFIWISALWTHSFLLLLNEKGISTEKSLMLKTKTI